MQKIVGFIALAALALVAYQGWRNASVPHRVDAQAASIACGQMAACSNLEITPTRVESGPFSRTYGFQTGDGEVVVTCRWPYLLWGEPECAAERAGGKPSAPKKPQRYPHQQDRGVPGN